MSLRSHVARSWIVCSTRIRSAESDAATAMSRPIPTASCAIRAAQDLVPSYPTTATPAALASRCAEFSLTGFSGSRVSADEVGRPAHGRRRDTHRGLRSPLPSTALLRGSYWLAGLAVRQTGVAAVCFKNPECCRSGPAGSTAAGGGSWRQSSEAPGKRWSGTHTDTAGLPDGRDHLRPRGERGNGARTFREWSEEDEIS